MLKQVRRSFLAAWFIAIQFIRLLQRFETVSNTKRKESRGSWLPIPYSVVWATAGFSKALTSIFDEYKFRLRSAPVDLTVGVAWKLSGIHLGRDIQKMQRQKLDQQMHD